jgi:hypothetical protein
MDPLPIVLGKLKQEDSRLTFLWLKFACISLPSSIAAALRPNVRQKLEIGAAFILPTAIDGRSHSYRDSPPLSLGSGVRWR